MGLVQVLALISLCGTPSGFGADSTDCVTEVLSRPQNIVRARLWRALCGGTGMPVLVDSLPASSGIEVCFPIDSTVCATYWIQSMNMLGKVSCLGAGLSFPRTVGVGETDDSVPEGRRAPGVWYDLQGRRLRERPTSQGLYWWKRPGHPAKLVRIM